MRLNSPTTAGDDMNDEQMRKRKERKAFLDFSKKRISRRTYGALLGGTGRYYFDEEVRILRIPRFGGRVQEYSVPMKPATNP